MDGFKLSFKDTRRDNIGMSVYNSGTQQCSAAYHWGPAVRDHYLLHYVKSGSGIYTVGGITYTLKAGDAFLIYPQTLVYYQAGEEDPWEYCWVGFHGNDARRLLRLSAFSEKEPVIRNISATLPCNALLGSIFAARGTQDHAGAAMIGHLYLFLSELIRTHPTSHSTQTLRQRHHQTALQFIYVNFMNDISVQEIANHVGISRSQLYRIFQAESGESPVDFLNRYRVHEALLLLREMHLSISQVAASAGFADPLYFSRVFKQHKGLSPSAYRAQLIQR